MKILCFHPALAPYRVDFFNALAKRSEFHLVLLSRNLLNQKFDQSSLLARLKCRVSYLLSGFIIGKRHFKLGFGKYIRDDRPDVVIGFEFGWTVMAIWLHRLLTRQRYKIYTTTDDNDEQVRNCKGVRKIARNSILRVIDGVIVTNEASSKRIQAIAPRLKTFIVPIIYDNDSIRSNEDEIFKKAFIWRCKCLKEGEKAAFFIGRLVPEKNIEWLLDRVEDHRWPEKVRLFIVGDGPLKENLEKRLNGSERLGRLISYMGRKEGFALQTFFAAEDFLILPSLSETFGAVVSESLHWGARCLVSSHVGAKDLVRETIGGSAFSGEEEFYAELNNFADEPEGWVMNRHSLIVRSVSEYVEKLLK